MFNKDESQIPENKSRFFYGYIIVATAFLIMVMSWGFYNVFGLFLNPLLDEFSWTSAMTSSAFSISMMLHGILGIAMGRINDRLGPRLVLTVCGILFGIGYLLMSQVSTVWQLYLFYGVIIGIGLSGIWVPLLSSVARWFDDRRSQMTGIVVTGLGVGGFIAPLVISRLIAAYGWRQSYIIQGIVIIAVIVIGAQFLRQAPAHIGHLRGENGGGQPGISAVGEFFYFKEAVCTPQFWVVIIMLFFYGFSAIAAALHLVPHAISLGIPPIISANFLAILNGASVIGSLSLGSLGDRIGSRLIYIICFVVMSASLLWLLIAREIWMFYVFAPVFGLAIGGMGPSESPLVARLFGLRFHGVIYAVARLGFTAGAAVGPFVVGYIFDITGGYHTAILVCAIGNIIGLVLVSILRPTKKIGIKL